MDLDVGLTVALLDQGRYQTLTERLRRAGFSPDETEEGRRTRQRWKIDAAEKVTVDFLISPSREEDQAGRLRDIEQDFAAIIAPGLRLAFLNRERVKLEGLTILGERASREIWVCSAGAYVVLKALAFESRGKNKDGYDLFYVLRNYGSGIESVMVSLGPLLGEPEVQQALDVLRRDFLGHHGIGPRRIAEFLTGALDDAIQADVVGFVKRLLDACSAALRKP